MAENRTGGLLARNWHSEMEVDWAPGKNNYHSTCTAVEPAREKRQQKAKRKMEKECGNRYETFTVQLEWTREKGLGQKSLV